jgi:hypothetical protein
MTLGMVVFFRTYFLHFYSILAKFTLKLYLLQVNQVLFIIIS